MDDCIRVLEEGQLETSRGELAARPRIDVMTSTRTPHHFYFWGTMEGTSKALQTHAIRMKSDVVYWPVVDGHIREEKYAGRPGLFCGLVFLFDTSTGEPLALMLPVAHARRRQPCHRGQVSGQTGRPRGRDAGLRRHGAQPPDGLLRGQADRPRQGVQPDGHPPRSVRGRNGGAAGGEGRASRTTHGRRSKGPTFFPPARTPWNRSCLGTCWSPACT